MKNLYKLRLQYIAFVFMLVSGPIMAQKPSTPEHDAAIGQGHAKTHVLGTAPANNADAKPKQDPDRVIVDGAFPAQPALTPDMRKHPETGKVKLEGSPESVEVMELRDANSRTFKNPDGSFTKQQVKGVFHYKDAQGYWRSFGAPQKIGGSQVGITETDMPIMINTTTGATQMQLDRAGNGIQYGKGAVITYTDANGNVLSTITASNATASQVDGATLWLKGMWPNIDRKQVIDFASIETDYVLQSKPAALVAGGQMVFTETVTLPQGWKVVKGLGKDTTFGWVGALDILDAQGGLKGRFERLVFFDSNTDLKSTDNRIMGGYSFTQDGNKLTLNVNVPANWLMDAERQYPVYIDPTASSTYGFTGLLEYLAFYSSCQEQMNVNVPAGTITGTATSYQIVARYGGWRSEQRSRMGVGSTWTATQTGIGNSAGTMSYSLTGLTLVNGAHGGGNILFTWQGYRTWADLYWEFFCDFYSQYLVSNSWVVTVTYTTTPCTGNPNPGTLAISAATGCAGSTNFTLTSTGYTTTGSGLEYNFQYSAAGANSWVDLTGWQALGSGNPTYTTNTTVDRDYRIQYRCSGGTAQNSNTVTHTPVTCIYLNVNQQVQTTCAAKIYDSGGPSGNYSNNEARVVIIYPTSPDQLLTVSGSYSTETGYDFISAVDGASSDISTYLNPHYYSGSNTFSVTAPGPGIPITIKFQSDGGVVGAGFDLDVSCSCASPTAGQAVAQNIINCGGTSDIYFSGADGQDFYSFVNTSFVGNTAPSGATVSGNATITGEYVRLTSTASSQAGSIVFNNVNGLDGNQLLGYFKIYAGGGSGADGMSFSFGPNISNTPGGSEAGHGNGLKISFDSYNNGAGVQPNCNGTNYSSVYLMYDNTVLGCYTTFNYTSWRNAWRLMVVSINENGQITVSNNEPGGPVYFSNVQLPAAYLTANKSTWKIAFSARTGGSTDNHYVDDVNFYFGNQFEYSINNGSTWSNSTTFSGLSAGTYNPRIRNKNVTCGSLALSNITIEAPPTLPTIPSVTNNGPVCTGSPVTLTAAGLAPSGKVANVTGTQTLGGSLVTAAANNFTMEFWVKPTATRPATTQSNTGTVGTSNQRYAIWPQHGSANAGAGVSVGTNGVSVFEHGDGYMPSVLVHEFQTPITDWMHVAVVYNNRTPSLYINGVLVQTGVQSARPNVYASSGVSGGYGYFQGQIDAIRIWNDVRTSSEIRSNMYYEAPTNTAGLVVRYDFNASNPNAVFGSPNMSNGGATYVDADFYTYTWSGAGSISPNGSTSSHTATVSSPTTSTYTVTYNSATNCGSVTGGSTAVTVNPLPSASISGTNTICAGGSSTFTASGGGTYAWSTGASTAAISVSTAGTYTVTVTNNGCTATASRTLTVNPLPSASISGTNTICAGGSSTFTASGGGTYAWSTGASTAAISVSTAGTYTVTVTNNGCTATASRTLTVSPLPSASISGTNTICAGGSSTFTASGGGTYAWSTGASTASISVSTAGTYTVTVTNNGCTATASRTLTVNSAPAASASNTGPYCVDGTISLTTTTVSGATYAWSGPNSFSSSSQSPTISDATMAMTGAYTVTVTASGCSATSSTTVTVDQPNVAGINAAISPATIANGDYLWVGQASTNWNAAANWYEFDGNNFQPATAFPGSGDNAFILPSGGCITTNSATVNVTSNVNHINIATSATLAFGSSQRLNVYGNWVNNGAITNSGTSTVAFMGSATQTATTGGNGSAPNKRFAQVILDKTGGSVIQDGNMLTTSNFTITNGIWDNTAGNYALQVQGNWNNGGTGQYLAGTSTVTFNSNSNRTITTGYSSGAPTGKTFYNVTKSGTGTHTLAGDLVGSNDLTITAGSVATSATGYDVTFTRDINSRGGSLDAQNATVTATRNLNIGTTAGVGTMSCNNCDVVVGNDAFIGVTAGNSGALTLSNGATLTVARDVILRNGTFGAGNAAINVTRNWTNSGVTFTAGTSQVTFEGSSNSNVTSGGQDFYQLNIEKNATSTSVTLIDDATVQNHLDIVTGNLVVPQDVVGQANTASVATAGQLTLQQVSGGAKGGELRVNP